MLKKSKLVIRKNDAIDLELEIKIPEVKFNGILASGRIISCKEKDFIIKI